MNNDEDTVTKLSIIVPYRDEHKEQKRKEQLKTFVTKMKSLIKDKINSRIYVIEQSKDDRLFNRGKLLNIGYDISKKDNYNDIIIFHDVDLIPDEELIQHYFKVPPKNTAVHIASVWNRYNKSNKYFGGITVFNKHDFESINGFPNNFWGWGGEDDELYHRVKQNSISIKKIKKGKIKDLENLELSKKLSYLKDKKLKNNVKWELRKEHDKTWFKNGLSNLHYKILNKTVKDKGFYHHIIVDATIEKD